MHQSLSNVQYPAVLESHVTFPFASKRTAKVLHRKEIKMGKGIAEKSGLIKGII